MLSPIWHIAAALSGLLLASSALLWAHSMVSVQHVARRVDVRLVREQAAVSALAVAIAGMLLLLVALLTFGMSLEQLPLRSVWVLCLGGGLAMVSLCAIAVVPESRAGWWTLAVSALALPVASAISL